MSSDAHTNDFYERIKPRLHKRIGRELRLARCVLDLGCGSCELVRYLAGTYHQRVTGVDISSDSFPKGRGLHDGVRIRCIRKDAAHLEFMSDNSVDAVVIMWALHEMTYPKAILAEGHRILRPGGEMLVVDFPRGSLAEELWHENYCTPDEIRVLLANAGFHETRAWLRNRQQIVWARGFRPESVQKQGTD